MVSPADFKSCFVGTAELRSSSMDLKRYHQTLSSVSKANLCLPIIDQDDHPGGFRICICDPKDKIETAKFDELSMLVINYPLTTQDLKRVDRNPGDRLNWTNNYTLPWLTLF